MPTIDATTSPRVNLRHHQAWASQFSTGTHSLAKVSGDDSALNVLGAVDHRLVLMLSAMNHAADWRESARRRREKLVGRQRSYIGECDQDPSYDDGCDDAGHVGGHVGLADQRRAHAQRAQMIAELPRCRLSSSIPLPAASGAAGGASLAAGSCAGATLPSGVWPRWNA